MLRLPPPVERLAAQPPFSTLRRAAEALKNQYGPTRDGEAPLERGRIPFLGCGWDYGQDAAGYLRGMQRKHGDVFTLFLAGNRTTFVLDPLDYPTVLLDKRLDFHELANEISAMAFGHTVESSHEAGYDEVTRMNIQHMRGPDLADMTARMQEELEAILLDPGFRAGDGLYDFVGRTIFFASGDAVFGRGFADESVHEAFDRLDEKFPLLVAGIPAGILPGVPSARSELAQKFLVPAPDACTLMREREALFEGVATDENRCAFEVALVWAAVANTIPATFWSLFYLMRDAEARRAVVDEVRDVMGDAPIDPDTGRALFTRAELDRMVVLDSAIDEALRLTSGSLVIRVAQEPVTLELPQGGTVALREGDRVALFPYLHHHDPELFEDPETYRYDRFIEDGKPKRRWTRRGERIRHYLMPFGGGVSICPGRHFARNEIKLCAAILLHHFDIGLLDTDAPPLDNARAGLGILPPTDDVRFRMTRASDAV